MRYQYNPYIGFLLASAFISLLLGIYAIVKQRHSKCASSFIMSMLIVTVWSGGNALEMSGADFQTKLFWANIQYFAYCYSPLALLALTMRFTGYDTWLRNRKFGWLLIIPSVIFLLVWTDGYHGLMRYNMHMDYRGDFPVIAKNYGSAFYIHAFYEHIINITSLVMLIRAVFYQKTVYRKQVLILLIGASLIVLPNLIYIIGLSPIKQFDITPVFFGPAGLLLAWAIFRYRMFDLVPLARAIVMERMNVGIVVLDIQNRILDINPAFETFMGTSIKLASGRDVVDFFQDIPGFAEICSNRLLDQAEFSLMRTGVHRIYEAVLSPLTDQAGELTGRLIVVYDITEKKKEEKKYLEQQKKIVSSREKERLARDLHDNLGQILGFINLQAQGIQRELANAGVENVNEKLERLVEVTRTAHEEIREYIANVRNLQTASIDFWETLQTEIHRFEQRSGICIYLESEFDQSEIELLPRLENHLLCIINEALNNIQKHSGANHVRLILSIVEGQMLITVKDDGKGFNILDKNISGGQSFGLSIMKERAKEIGARLFVESELGKGCRVSIQLPLPQEVDKN